ncbi:thioesterase [Enemella dayhoffiae]|uniref:Acyl-coenzyme A thioesterase THEM4 n=1 Tax=Enemella dayhoffiae TaxID=2016507 RepID=A0A255HAJ5_9ACTN|nr:PaaI family thioesterase [Enemella dayhoffiae]OYO24326.1 thioesterase [Enemella dayhoffiae]
MEPAIQDHYPDDAAACYGCGRLNDQGLQLKTRWVSDGSGETATETESATETVFTPRPEHTAMPGFVYGGLVASVIDCSGTGSASLAATRDRGIDLVGETGSDAVRFVTGTLEVRYQRPTPMGPPLVVRGRIAEVKGRKVTVELTMTANGETVATGRVIALEAPDTMRAAG